MNFTLTGSNGITGPTALTMTGTGSVTITNSNSYTGGTSIVAGAIVAQNGLALGSGTVTATGGGALELQGGVTVANPLVLSGMGAATGGALHSLSGSNTYNGPITLAAAGASTPMPTNSPWPTPSTTAASCSAWAGRATRSSRARSTTAAA